VAIVFHGDNVYIYKCTRKDGRFKCEYIASGLAAAMLGLAEIEQRARREQLRRKRAERTAVDTAVADLVQQARGLAEQFLVEAGYARGNRGPWRSVVWFGSARRMPVVGLARFNWRIWEGSSSSGVLDVIKK
jgi:hypothetical protein